MGDALRSVCPGSPCRIDNVSLLAGDSSSSLVGDTPIHRATIIIRLADSSRPLNEGCYGLSNHVHLCKPVGVIWRPGHLVLRPRMASRVCGIDDPPARVQ